MRSGMLNGALPGCPRTEHCSFAAPELAPEATSGRRSGRLLPGSPTGVSASAESAVQMGRRTATCVVRWCSYAVFGSDATSERRGLGGLLFVRVRREHFKTKGWRCQREASLKTPCRLHVGVGGHSKQCSLRHRCNPPCTGVRGTDSHARALRVSPTNQGADPTT